MAIVDGTAAFASDVVAALSGKLDLAGGVLGGPLTLPMNTVANPAIFAPGVITNPIGQYETLVNGRAQVLSEVVIATSPAAGGVFFNVKTDTTISGTAAPDGFFWNVLNTVAYNSTGGGQGQHVAVYNRALRYKAATQPTTTITSATPGSAVTSITVANVANFQKWNAAPITSGNPGTCFINGRSYPFTVTGTSGSGTLTAWPAGATFAVADATNGVTVKSVNNPQMWAGLHAYGDYTGLSPSDTGISLCMEYDFFCDGPDDYTYPAAGRIFQSFILKNYSGSGTASMGAALSFYADLMSQYRCIIQIAPQTAYSRAVLDISQATELSGANAIWLGDGQHVALDDAGKWRLSYDPGTTRAILEFNGARIFSIDSSGNVRAAGTFTGSTTP